MTDTAPKTLVEEMAEAVQKRRRDQESAQLRRDTMEEEMEIGARVLLERMREFRKSSDGTPASHVDINEFAREHGLSAEDEI